VSKPIITAEQWFKRNNRLTRAWTDTLEQAYGEIGAKGKQGEDWLYDQFVKKDFSVIGHDESKEHQLKGIDLTVTSNSTNQTWTIDVKSNIKDDGTFFVETDNKGWLMNPYKTSTYIWHVNPKTGWMAWYYRKDMKKHIASSNQTRKLVSFNVNTVTTQLPFVKTKQEVNK
jgi:hypothetical protein